MFFKSMTSPRAQKEQQKTPPTPDKPAVSGAHALTKEEKKALALYEKTHHLSAIPHEDTNVPVERSSGEVVFNTITYKGIGWILNAAISVYLTDLLMHGKGKNFFDKSIHKLAPFFQRMVGGTEEAAQKTARGSMMTAGLFSGGTILLYPIKKLEDHKAAIVKWLDSKFNNLWAPTKEESEIQERAHQRLEADPKPSWPNIILGRILGTVSVVVAVLGIYNPENATKIFAKKTGEAMQESSNLTIKALGGSNRFRNLFALSIIESYTSLIAEEVLYFTTRFYRKLHREKEIEARANGNGDNHPDTLREAGPAIEKGPADEAKFARPASVVSDHVIANANQQSALSLGA